ncbi:NADH-quinone oxidoreductase subunit NuoE [Candidatus Erwinia haradaeae]|uniref:NADH-quinone oxidoreductase subunit E n=1 Tax=Candidatus Erwinia haradaeae TaxID=1922217 RepID=A0A451DG65_9GAMM|nr:NADH-quinone oxidoreductase subunit NuoE [Candidatus Erwinia haradaeae]VFP85629.1 NADH-quinone oxidoreductase subunit E [Candidatus Erwinia haradaeae]
MHENKILIKIRNESNDTTLSSLERAAIAKERIFYEEPHAVIIEALHIIQKYRGWVSDSLIKGIADILEIPTSDVEEVATFYSQIYRMPVGRHIIKYCDSVVCYILGYQIIQQRLEEHLNIKPGQTTEDKRFTLLPTCCLGNCDKGPALMINEHTYGNVTPQDIIKLLERYP